MGVFMNPAFEIKDLTYGLGFITSRGEFQSDNSKLTVQFRVLQPTYDSYGKTMYFEVMGLNNLKAECYKVLINGMLYSSTDLSDSTKVVFSELSKASSYIAIQFSNRDGSYFKEEDIDTIFNKDVTIRMYSNERKQPTSIYIGVPTYDEKAYEIKSEDLYGSSSSSYYINSSGYVSDSSKKNISTVSLFPKSQSCDHVDITYDATKYNVAIHCFNNMGEYLGKKSTSETAVQYGLFGLKARFNCIKNTSYIKITLTIKDGTITNADYINQISKVRIYEKNEDDVGVAKKVSAIYVGHKISGKAKLVYRSKAKEPSINSDISFSLPSNLFYPGVGYTKDYAIYTCGYIGLDLKEPGKTYAYDKNLVVRELNYPFVDNNYRIYNNSSATDDNGDNVVFAGAKYKEVGASNSSKYTSITNAFKYNNDLSCTHLAALSSARCPCKSAYFNNHYIFAGGYTNFAGEEDSLLYYSDVVDMYDDDFTLTTLSKLQHTMIPNCAVLKDHYCFISSSVSNPDLWYNGCHYIDTDFTVTWFSLSSDKTQDMVANTKDYIIIGASNYTEDYDFNKTYTYSYYTLDKDRTKGQIPYFGDNIESNADTYSSDDYALFIGGAGVGSLSEQIKIIDNELVTKTIDNPTGKYQYVKSINRAKNKLLVEGSKQNFIINI